MLSVEQVTKRYGKFTALEDISLAFSSGVYGLPAPNGAGKTTLIKMLTTLIFPAEGKFCGAERTPWPWGRPTGACWAICPRLSRLHLPPISAVCGGASMHPPQGGGRAD